MSWSGGEEGSRSMCNEEERDRRGSEGGSENVSKRRGSMDESKRRGSVDLAKRSGSDEGSGIEEFRQVSTGSNGGRRRHRTWEGERGSARRGSILEQREVREREMEEVRGKEGERTGLFSILPNFSFSRHSSDSGYQSKIGESAEAKDLKIV